MSSGTGTGVSSGTDTGALRDRYRCVLWDRDRCVLRDRYRCVPRDRHRCVRAGPIPEPHGTDTGVSSGTSTGALRDRYRSVSASLGHCQSPSSLLAVAGARHRFLRWNLVPLCPSLAVAGHLVPRGGRTVPQSLEAR
ncbi:hypothetical protein DUI87_28419 [Hirundo rustica rustica]|uniref:Uncharacterized protein n=1 Tax=Hirundo rustica rustica TaxID=333673 RepID=A0A3M0J8F8_HIRRU|nr:hypothetical protein DUI87_28419 [Hirundo rustica rustica]